MSDDVSFSSIYEASIIMPEEKIKQIKELGFDVSEEGRIGKKSRIENL